MNNNAERIKMIKAMEYIARQVNDETVFWGWLSLGVADGDIPYGELELKPNDELALDYYIQPEEFAETMRAFLSLMRRASRSGGLYCGGVTSLAESKKGGQAG